MLLFANGAIKSGSTWLFHLARELTSFGPPPAHYANPKWTSQPAYSIDQTRLAEFLSDAQIGARDVLSKNHFGALHERKLLLTHPQVRVLNIRRDVRDVVVSAYSHDGSDRPPSDDFPTYYWARGRQVAQRVLDYQIIWDVRSPRYCCLTYEGLVADFASEAGRLARFLGLAPTSTDLERVRQATSPTALSARYPFGDFNRFRSGQAGEWWSHFDAVMTEDVAQIIRRSRHPLHRLALVGPARIRRVCRWWRFAPESG